MTSADLVPLFTRMEWADARRELPTHVHLVRRAFLQLRHQAPVTAMADSEGGAPPNTDFNAWMGHGSEDAHWSWSDARR